MAMRGMQTSSACNRPLLRNRRSTQTRACEVGAAGFEPATFRPPAERATKLRHAPVPRVYAKFPSERAANMCSIMAAEDRFRKCYRCRELKPIEDFAWRRKAKGQRDSFCRPCRSAYGKEHYAANRQLYIDQAAAQKQRLRRERTIYLLDFFETHPCVDCGERDPIVLEFDHLRDKSFAIGPHLCRRSWKAILREIRKCEVVCANCHRRRTAQRRGTVRALLTAR